jgi:hypothetical protein
MFPGSRQPFENDSLSVMAGLRPGHPRLSCFGAVKAWMPRHKAGHDEPNGDLQFHWTLFRPDSEAGDAV